MGQFTKQYFIGTVQAFDGRIYHITIPDGQTAILKYTTVHQMCKFPDEMLEDDHLKVGASIKLCRIVKNDKVSILPDHRFYYSGKDNTVFSLGFGTAAIILLSILLTTTKK